ncbi:MAG: Zn-dependent hydrolase [Spirochaetes bacterium]|nr:Zn-dependent hydrolase [Spirochaetota bacterium]
MPRLIESTKQRIEEIFSQLEKIGNLGASREEGFTRAAWSNEETRGMELIQRIAEKAGMRASWDGIGNLFLSTPVGAPETVQVGSHLDTVPHGGNYDGAAGIVAGLDAILQLRPMWEKLKRRLELVIWRGEESACYGAVCKGSQAAFGLNDPSILSRTYLGQTLEEAIRSQGFDPSYIQERRPTVDQARIDSIAAHLELHIEQAKRLETDGIPIGVVTSIRGTIRLRVLIFGEANHSGGTPMGIRYRKDANLAMAYMQVALHEECTYALEKGFDIVQTVGVINADEDYNKKNPQVWENALTKVSPFGYFTLDVRSNDPRFLPNYIKTAEEIIRKKAERYNVNVQIERLLSLDPVERLDPSVQGVLESACRDLKIPYLVMPSGALHDAAVVAGVRKSNGSPIPVGMLFIPCKDGISHNPAEYASAQDIARGAVVLSNALYRLAR